METLISPFIALPEVGVLCLGAASKHDADEAAMTRATLEELADCCIDVGSRSRPISSLSLRRSSEAVPAMGSGTIFGLLCG